MILSLASLFVIFFFFLNLYNNDSVYCCSVDCEKRVQVYGKRNNKSRFLNLRSTQLNCQRQKKSVLTHSLLAFTHYYFNLNCKTVRLDFSPILCCGPGFGTNFIFRFIYINIFFFCLIFPPYTSTSSE